MDDCEIGKGIGINDAMCVEMSSGNTVDSAMLMFFFIFLRFSLRMDCSARIFSRAMMAHCL